MVTSIFFNELEFFGTHGWYTNERNLKQKFLISLQLFGDFSRAMYTDDINDTINYSSVYSLVKEVVEQNSFKLIETLARTIVEVLFTNFQTIQQANITVKKFPKTWDNKNYGDIGFQVTISR